jgi:hypothetical protein
LQVFAQIVTSHCQQHGVKIDAAPEIRLVPFAPVGADVADLMHASPPTSTITLPSFTAHQSMG